MSECDIIFSVDFHCRSGGISSASLSLYPHEQSRRLMGGMQ